MVNAGRVNAQPGYRFHRNFANFLRVFARFLLLRNPVKYTGGFEINQSSGACRKKYDTKSVIYSPSVA
jgi:hypothetical protein